MHRLDNIIHRECTPSNKIHNTFLQSNPKHEKASKTDVREKVCTLTQFSYFKDLTQHFGKLDTAAAKRTLVLVFTTAVLQDNLKKKKKKSH